MPAEDAAGGEESSEREEEKMDENKEDKQRKAPTARGILEEGEINSIDSGSRSAGKGKGEDEAEGADDSEGDKEAGDDDRDNNKKKKRPAHVEEADAIEDICSDRELAVCCEHAHLTDECKITQVGKRQHVMRCKKHLESVQQKQKSFQEGELGVEAKRKAVMTVHGRCSLLDNPGEIEAEQCLGDKSTLTLRSIMTTVASNEPGKKGSSLFVPLCRNVGCLIPEHRRASMEI